MAFVTGQNVWVPGLCLAGQVASLKGTVVRRLTSEEVALFEGQFDLVVACDRPVLASSRQAVPVVEAGAVCYIG